MNVSGIQLGIVLLVIALSLLAGTLPKPLRANPEASHDFFVDEVWPKVLGHKCLKCHKKGGDAEESNFVLQDPSRDSSEGKKNSLKHNRSSFTRIAKLKDKGEKEWVVLLKVIDEIDHEGGEVLKPGSGRLKILRDYVLGINGEKPTLSSAKSYTSNFPYEQKPFFEGITMLDDRRLLRRLTLSLAGRLPTEKELSSIRAEKLKALEPILDNIMKEDAFYTRLSEGFNDIFLTRGYDGVAERALSYEHFGETRGWTAKFDLSNVGDKDAQLQARYKLSRDYREAMLKEPMELVKYIVRNDRPFTEIINADYIMVSPYTARGYGIFEELKDKFKNTENPFEYLPIRLKALQNRDGKSHQESPTGFYPHAGILSTFQYLKRYPTTETNRNRLRTRMYYLHFLGIDVMELAPRVNDAAAITAKFEVPTMEASDCVVCHKTIDPLSGLFQDFYVVDGKGVYGPRKEGWYTDMFGPGFEGEDLPKEERWRSLQWLADRTVKDPRFSVAMVEHVYYIMTGRKPLRPPEDLDDLLYEARWRAYSEQRKEIEAIAGHFKKANFNLKAAFKAWALSDFYHADGLATAAANPHREAELADIGLVRMLAPEQMERKLKAIFGIRWGRLESQFKILYGGIDSKEVLERINEPSGAMGAIQRMMANDMSCKTVVMDFAKDPEARLLFPEVELNMVPGNNTDHNQRIRKTIVHLHDRILGRHDSLDSPDVDLTYSLFAGIIEDVNAIGKFEKRASYSCGRVDEKRVDDSFYALRAWRGVITYLLRQHEFLYE